MKAALLVVGLLAGVAPVLGQAQQAAPSPAPPPGPSERTLVLTPEQKRVLESARFTPGSRLVPQTPDPKILTIWVLLPRLLPADVDTLCAVSQAVARAKGELQLYLSPTSAGPGAYNVAEGSCLASIGISPISAAGISRWWGVVEGYEPQVIAHYGGKSAMRPLSAWRTAIEALR